VPRRGAVGDGDGLRVVDQAERSRFSWTRRDSSRRRAWSAAIRSASVPLAARAVYRAAAASVISSAVPPLIRPCLSYSATTVASPSLRRRLAVRSQAAGTDRLGQPDMAEAVG